MINIDFSKIWSIIFKDPTYEWVKIFDYLNFSHIYEIFQDGPFFVFTLPFIWTFFIYLILKMLGIKELRPNLLSKNLFIFIWVFMTIYMQPLLFYIST